MNIGKIILKNSIDKYNPKPVILYGIKSKLINIGYFKHLNPGKKFDIHKGEYQDKKSKKKWYAIQIKEFMAGVWL